MKGCSGGGSLAGDWSPGDCAVVSFCRKKQLGSDKICKFSPPGGLTIHLSILTSFVEKLIFILNFSSVVRKMWL